MKILADAHIPYLKGVAEQFGDVEYIAGNQFNKDNIKDKDILIVRTVTHFDETNLSGSQVKLICSATIGYDHIDTEYCDLHGIGWRTAPGCNANSVEQYVTASLLHLSKQYNFDLKDKTIGIIGVGNVGSRVEAACRKLGMRVMLNDPPRQENEQNKEIFSSLDALQEACDILTFHTPLIKAGKYKTYHLADKDFFEKLSKRPFIINTCRGSVVETNALKEAIKNNLIAGAVIDCWEHEPNIDLEMLEMATIATPHIAGYSADGKWTGTKMSLENINSYFHYNLRHLELLEIQKPANEIIDLKHVPTIQQVEHAIWHSYNPMTETEALKSHPDQFYWFRSHYPLRREYGAYKIVNADLTAASVLEKLGFRLL